MRAERRLWETVDFELPVRVDRQIVVPAEHTERLRYGLIPRGMEDKWFVFYEDEVLYCHRSWTGNLFFKVPFKEDAGALIADHFFVERSNRHKDHDDDSNHAVLSMLIFNVILRQPWPLLWSGNHPVAMWCAFGRAIFPDRDDE